MPITEQDVRYEDGAVVSLLRQTLVRAIAAKRDLGTDGSRVLWKKDKYTTEREGREFLTSITQLAYHYVVSARRCILLLIQPSTFQPKTAENKDAIRNVRLRLLGYQHNDKFNAALNDWRKLILTQNEPTEFDFPPGSASFQFTAKSAPAFAAIRQPQRPAIKISDNFGRLIHHRGIEVPEQALRFANRGQTVTTDTLPLRGLADKGPFDQEPVLAQRRRSNKDCCHLPTRRGSTS